MIKKIFLALLVITGITACDEDEEIYSPKPRGYIRLDFPEKKYKLFDTTCPFAFEIPQYGKMKPNTSPQSEPCWYNLEFPSFRAILHLSYKQVNKNLDRYLDDAHDIANKHQL